MGTIAVASSLKGNARVGAEGASLQPLRPQGLSSIRGNWSTCKTSVVLQELTSRQVLGWIQVVSCHLSAPGTGEGRGREGQRKGEKGGGKTQIIKKKNQNMAVEQSLANGALSRESSSQPFQL